MSRANAVRHAGTFFDAIPELLIEWDKSRNGSLNPGDFSPKSSNKVWWKCVRGHSWEATIASRTSGSNCPRCVLHGTSHIELRLFTELSHFFPSAKLKEKVSGHEVDIYLEEIMVGIEIDGYHWHLHGKNLGRDQRKNEALEDALYLIRLRDDRLPPLSANDLAMNSKEPYKSIVNKVLTALLPYAPEKKQRIQAYVANKNFHNSTEYLRLLQRLPKPLKGQSFAERCPDLIADWAPELNAGLSGYDVYPTTADTFVWKCSKCGATYEMSVLQKYQYGSSCPMPQCHVPPPGRALCDLNPQLAVEWDMEKNSPITPPNVYTKTKTNYWWRCGKCNSSFEATPENRVLYPYRWGCQNPECSARSMENSVARTAPHLVADWHPTRNLPLRPETISATSSKLVWWKCHDCGVERELSPAHRLLVKTTCGSSECRNNVKLKESGTLKRKRGYTEEQVQQVIEMRGKSLTLTRIQELTGISRSTVDRILKEYST